MSFFRRLFGRKPKNEKINSFLYCFFKSQAVRLTVEKISGGTSQKNLSQKRLKN